MFALVEWLFKYETDLETAIATYLLTLSFFAMIGVGTVIWWVWSIAQ